MKSKYFIFFLSFLFFGCNEETYIEGLLPPVADFEYTASSFVAPSTVSFSSTSSNASEYFWEFGDGSGISYEENPVYTYYYPGTYQVKLTCKGPGGTDIKTKLIVIEEAGPYTYVGTFKIRNAYRPTSYLNTAGSIASCTPNQYKLFDLLRVNGATSDSYYFRSVDGNLFLGDPQCASCSDVGATSFYDSNSIWRIEQVQQGSAYFRIKQNSSGKYMHTENGNLQLGSVLSGWTSAWWILENP